ncbi:Brassinosteroid-responsive RING protein 1 [Hirschfeldia incana]|nr:Brassinosteroid-responsive RING protein 1 [Hirschfeldia incana]
MGFPVGYTEVFLPKLFVQTLSILSFIRTLVFSLFRFLGLSDFLEMDQTWPDYNTSHPTRTQPELRSSPFSALLIREILPVIKFQDVTTTSSSGEDLPESCAVCLYEFEGEQEIRWLRNCRHIFHRSCLDRWMDHDQKTCPLCRTPFVPDEMQEEFNQRLWAASGVHDFHSEYYCPVTEL